MKTRVITFRTVFITIAILLVANICVNLFIAAAKPHQDLDTDGVTRTYYPPDHDGTCICDGLDPNCKLNPANISYGDMVNITKDFQLDYQANGDILIYTIEDENVQVYVGVYKHGSKCDLQQIMNDYLRDND